MKGMEDASIDLILADPPYGTTSCRWDRELPVEALWESLRRLIKPTGVICLFGSEPYATRVRYPALDIYKYDWIWLKGHSTGFQHAKNMPLKSHELISVFSPASIGHESLLHGRRMPYSPQGLVRVDKLSKPSVSKFGSVVGERPSHRAEYLTEFESYPKMLLEYAKDGSLHPSQKPVALLEYLIRTYTQDGAEVLDFCMGSGSTGVACLNTGRNFTGIELDADYYRKAHRRLMEAGIAGITGEGKGTGD